MALKQQLIDWQAKNPLRVWRQSEGLTLADAAVLIGTGVSSIQWWENGAQRPSADSMALISEATGIARIESKWSAWQSRCPSAA